MITAFVTFRYGEDFDAAKGAPTGGKLQSEVRRHAWAPLKILTFSRIAGKRAMSTFGTTLRRRGDSSPQRTATALLHNLSVPAHHRIRKGVRVG